MPKRGINSTHGARIKTVITAAEITAAARSSIVGGVLTGPRPHGYTDEMLSKDMRAARQAMMTKNKASMIQAKEDIKAHIDRVHNQRARV